MNQETKYELVKFIDNELEIEVSVSPNEDTIWASANQVLKEYLIKGYAINENSVVVSNENFNNLLTVVNDIKSNQIIYK